MAPLTGHASKPSPILSNYTLPLSCERKSVLPAAWTRSSGVLRDGSFPHTHIYPIGDPVGSTFMMDLRISVLLGTHFAWWLHWPLHYIFHVCPVLLADCSSVSKVILLQSRSKHITLLHRTQWLPFHLKSQPLHGPMWPYPVEDPRVSLTVFIPIPPATLARNILPTYLWSYQSVMFFGLANSFTIPHKLLLKCRFFSIAFYDNSI